MGRVVPDKAYPGMWRSTKVDGILSDGANLSWSKGAVLAQAAREVAYEHADTPSKPSKREGLSAEIVAHALNAAWAPPQGWIRSNSRPKMGTR
jgi:hypothetical protein